MRPERGRKIVLSSCFYFFVCRQFQLGFTKLIYFNAPLICRIFYIIQHLSSIDLSSWLQVISEGTILGHAFHIDMAEGTQFRELDTRMSAQEAKLTELGESLGQNRAEVKQ